MEMTGNTIFITGGGSGIGRGLAEAFFKSGNEVIIAGRRKKNLAETLKANPGMESIELDVQDAESISAVAKELTQRFPKLNVLINNAGIMQIDDVSGPVDDAIAVATITTNLLGPIRLTSALVGHLKQQKPSAIINMSSVLGFVPLAMTAVYSSTKAAMHSYSLSLRHKLRHSPVKVIEIAPPWVQTDLLNSNNEPRAMPLADFIRETMALLDSDAKEIVVERGQQLRDNVGRSEGGFVTQFNEMMEQPQ
jgi:uncharacterized oxidoreductase